MTEERSFGIIAEAELIMQARIASMEQAAEMPEEGFYYENDIPIDINPFYAKLSLKPVEIYSGQTDEERIEAYMDTMTSCGYEAQTGDVMDFVLIRRENLLVQTDLCNRPLPEHWEGLRAGKLKDGP